MRLFGDHRLALDDAFRVRRRRYALDDSIGFLRCVRPVDLDPVGEELLFELFEILGQMGDGAQATRPRGITHGVGILEGGQPRLTADAEQARCAIEGAAQVVVREREPHARAEIARRSFVRRWLCHERITRRESGCRRACSTRSTPRPAPWF